MLVVALAAIVATEMLWDTSLDLRRTRKLLERDQAQQIAIGLELLAGELLRADFDDDPRVDSLQERWAEEYGFPFDGGTVVGQLTDMQGRFNLNSLIDDRGRRVPQAADQFRRLVEAAAIRDDDLNVDPESVVDAVVDWLDPDQLPDGIGGAEDGVYTSRTPPYRAANTWFTTPTELLAVDNVVPALYERLANNITALPPRRATAININTATPEVLASLSAEIGTSLADVWVDSRQSAPFETVEEFLEQAGDVFNEDNPVPNLDVGSQWFGLTVIVSIGSTRLGMYSLLERNAQDGTVAVRLRAFDTP
jgi:general secretion pathway protein K